MAEITKRCTICKEFKSLEQFYNDKRSTDGRQERCKLCHCETIRNSPLTSLGKREARHLEKMKVLMHYSNPRGMPICNNCSEQDIDVLSIDHINGGGSKHIRSLAGKFYHWLIKNDYPEGYQVLCFNCNVKKDLFKR